MKTTSTTPILRRTRADLITTAALTVVALIAVGAAWFSAPIRDAKLTTAVATGQEVPAPLATIPQNFTESFRAPNTLTPGQHRAVVTQGVVVTADTDGLHARYPDGATAWDYQRSDAALCSLSTAWNKVVATYSTGVGCGDVVTINAATGTYSATRSAPNSPEVVPIASNDRVGTVSTERVELWRSDMVRTVEYGNVEAKQEAGFQPHEECTINSAMTRTELLVVSETCPDNEGVTWLRFQNTTPEDSRKPEILADAPVGIAGARLVAVGQTAAAIYDPTGTPSIVSFDDKGEEISRVNVARSPAIQNAASPFSPSTADLPHHMTWFDGDRLYLFTPTTLKIDHVFEDAIGTGVAVDDRLLFPTPDGIAVANWSTGQIERTIPIDRGNYHGQANLSIAGNYLVETRDTEVVTYAAS